MSAKGIDDIVDEIEEYCSRMLFLAAQWRDAHRSHLARVATHDYAPITLHERCGDDPPSRELEEPA